MDEDVSQREARIRLLRQLNRQYSETSLEYFTRIYLDHHFSIDQSSLQTTLFHQLTLATANRRLILKAPRGSGKSTVIGLAFALWCLSHRKKRFIIYIHENDEKAKDAIGKIRSEIENNELLRNDFAKELTPGVGKVIKRLESYSNSMIQFENGSIVLGIGKGSALRGLNKRGTRPDCIIYDDPQGKHESESQALRDKDKATFDTEIRYLGGPQASLDIILIGTMIHFDCLIEYVSQKPGWEKIEVSAVESAEQKKTFWDAVYCYDTSQLQQWEIDNWGMRGQDKPVVLESGEIVNCKSIRQPFYGTIYKEGKPWIVGLHDENPESFNQEMLHLPIQLEGMPLRRELWRYYPFTVELIRKLPLRLGALDPSMGKGDYQAISVVGKDAKNYYLLDGSLTRFDLSRGSQNENSLIERVILMIQAYDLKTFMVEDNGAQGLFINSLNSELSRRGIFCALRPHRSTGKKEERITGILGLITQRGSMYIREDWEQVYPVFMRQWEQFPKGSHDDAPDATTMALIGLQKMAK